MTFFLLFHSYSIFCLTKKTNIEYMGGPKFTQTQNPALIFTVTFRPGFRSVVSDGLAIETFCKRDLGLLPHENVQCFDFRCAVELSSLIHLEFSRKVGGVFLCHLSANLL